MQKLYTEDIPADVKVKGNIIISFRNDEVCDTLRQYLHAEGYGVYICKSLEEFMELEHVNVMCIVIDVTPGYASTFHAIEIIKQTPVGASIPILVVADVNSTQNVVRALNAGASDYLLQPYSQKEFLHRALSLVSSAGV
ncbi:MAG: response regulator transcription factor [Bacteroidales bacterium]|nr:response regulator transcription factor [Bacteroidales bacterium]MBD5228956.1 response regulator transcription factor [Bacteroidales bacterium]MBD5235168.1 response regulator transcription factor [Barnesiella sp.]MBD5247285.1 response regulator transcription factor [Barnesiella sp.]MBD5257187.1 response regulator transcription factor [Barnesiella sp.]